MTYTRGHSTYRKALLHEAIQTHSHAEATAQFLPLLMIEPFKSLSKLACCVAIIGCFAGLYKLGYLDWVFNGAFWNIRNIPGVKKLLLRLGYDEFPGAGAHVTVYACKDVKNTAVIGKAQLYVQVGFWFRKYETKKVKDGTWNESFTLEIPQGATTCDITVFSKGKITTDTIGTIQFHTLPDILDGKLTRVKKWHKIMKDQKEVGQLQFLIEPTDVDSAGRVQVSLPLVDLPEDSSMNFIHQIKLHMPDPSKTGTRRAVLMTLRKRGSVCMHWQIGESQISALSQSYGIFEIFRIYTFLHRFKVKVLGKIILFVCFSYNSQIRIVSDKCCSDSFCIV